MSRWHEVDRHVIGRPIASANARSSTVILSLPQPSRPSGGLGAVAPGHGARPGEMPRSNGRTRLCGTCIAGSSRARRLTAPPRHHSRPRSDGLSARRCRGPEAQAEASAASGRPSCGQPGHRERRWRGPRARTCCGSTSACRAKAHSRRTPPFTAQSVDTSSSARSHAPWEHRAHRPRSRRLRHRDMEPSSRTASAQGSSTGQRSPPG